MTVFMADPLARSISFTLNRQQRRGGPKGVDMEQRLTFDLLEPRLQRIPASAIPFVHAGETDRIVEIRLRVDVPS